MAKKKAWVCIGDGKTNISSCGHKKTTGDTRRGRHFVPLAYRVMDTFLDSGFILKEDIIKVQHNCSATGRWVGKARKAGFYLIMHEHLFVFRKADKNEDLGRVKESRKSIES